MMSPCCIWGLLLFLSLTSGWTKAQQTNKTRPEFDCGGDLVANTGYFASEGFPDYYKPNSKCTWRITVPEGNVITLTFRLFDLEADLQCRYDYLEVYDGHSNMVQKLGRFCGPFRPGPLISSTNIMMVEMGSDEETQGHGFLAVFSGAKPFVNDEKLCGGKMTKSQGEIKTPNWPEKKYPPGISCTWLITVEPNMVIQVKFDKFILELDSFCRFDYVLFFNGGERNDSRLIGRYCGVRTPEPIITSGNKLLVHFVSDQTLSEDGFLAYYTSIPRGSQSATVEAGSITPVIEPAEPKRPAVPVRITTTTVLPTTTITTTTTTTTKARVSRPNGKRPVLQNPLCAKACKRVGTIKTAFCSSEFVITGTVTSLTPGPRGTLHIKVSLIKAYKAGRLTITQVGETMAVKLVSQCKKCPLLRRGANHIIMGQVDDEGRGTLAPGAFTASYKTQHDRLLTNINNQPC